MCNFIRASSDFVSGTMTGDICVLSENGPPGGASGGPPGGASGGPPSGSGGEGGGSPTSRNKRQAPTVNLETFAIDNTAFFAVQDKPVKSV